MSEPTIDDIARVMASLGRRRAAGQDMAAVGKLGGRPRTAPRCPCGKYTVNKAACLRHVCPESFPQKS